MRQHNGRQPRGHAAAFGHSHANERCPAIERGPVIKRWPVIERAPISAPSVSRKPKRATLAFGKSYTWRDGVRVTVGKPRTFKPSRYAVVEKSKHYVKFPITVVNKAEKPIDIGWTHINVQSKDKEADQFYDSLSGLKGPPAKKVSKGREATFEVGFAVADPDDLTMELALDGDRQRPRLRYST